MMCSEVKMQEVGIEGGETFLFISSNATEVCGSFKGFQCFWTSQSIVECHPFRKINERKAGIIALR